MASESTRRHDRDVVIRIMGFRLQGVQKSLSLILERVEISFKLI